MTSKQFLYIVIITFITVIIWVTLDIMHSRANIQPAPEIKQLLDPVDPQFDQQTLNEL